jgi:cellulose synthase/poly-beta-1,6-N-acetylglucosamine synthase-like glycosyltransferase
MEALFILSLVVYILDIIVLFYYGIHCFVMVKLFFKYRRNCESDPARLEELVTKMKVWPKVTIQLPMFNEYYVAERLIDTTMQVRYPKNKFEVQVLDDSTDETTDLVRKKVAFYKKKGFDIKLIHRVNRQGHKAGALKEAQELAKGEFVAIFDADFLPAEDFLEKTVPYFYEADDIGMVQTRWGHINADYSILTKGQSLGIDGHFTIEQIARGGSGLWMNFNGTAGIWRKSCIYDAGNWSADTLTEDFDLSYRAELKGWRFKYIVDVVNPAELPATVSAYKSQQFRWCKGSIQTTVKLAPTIFRTNLPWKVKLEALTHLTNYLVHPLMVINILATLPVLYFSERLGNVPDAIIGIAAVFFSLGTFGPIAMYLVSQKVLYNRWFNRVAWMPVLTMIGTGIAVSNTRAVWQALTGKKSTFIRTPKLRIEGSSDKVNDRMKYAGHVKLDKTPFLEFLMGIYSLMIIYTAFAFDRTMFVPFMVMYAAGFFYISIASFYENFKEMRAKREFTMTAAAAAALVGTPLKK